MSLVGCCTRVAIVAASLLSAACGDDQPAGCVSDRDCKGERVCNAGQCMDPRADGGGSGADGGSGGSGADPCDRNHGGCDPLVSCSSSGGIARCGDCPEGYDDTRRDGTLCEDVDECASDNGGCGEPERFACVNHEGAAPSCEDVDECASDNGGCAQLCTNTEGSYSCACEESYVLEADEHGCRSRWSTPVSIERGDGDAGVDGTPQIAISPSGHAVVVFAQIVGASSSIMAVRFVPASGWGPERLIESDDTGHAFHPQVGMDGSGNAIAVWHQSDASTRHDIWSNRFVLGTGWSGAAKIETDDAGYAVFPQVGVNASGNAVAVWSQFDGMRENIWSNRFTGNSWGTAVLIETNDTGGAARPQVTVDGSGNAIAVWQHHDGTRENIWTNRFTGSSWAGVYLLEVDNAGRAVDPQVGFDGLGGAGAIWSQSDGTRFNLAGAFFRNGQWGAATRFGTDNVGDVAAPQMAWNSAGHLTRAWQQSDGTRTSIWAIASDSAFTQLETDDAGDATRPQVATDEQGNAFVVWQQSDGTRTHVWFNRFVPGAGWGTARLLESDDAGDARDPQVAVDASGRAIAVWRQSDGTRFSVWASRFE